ncbi:MAG: hypothetical protein CL881_06870 [Dehalococcoidia bacterium]|nr:hypothetical protein [Dehalococcoidia bacterium]|tara:strand:- start:7116 stop:8414 length:1299 start_codon:yes stop_codon:yes gene_type:complete
MKIHIVGAGPTGMSLAWELLRTGDHEVTVYDRKTSAGGSWWEPDEEVRDLHAHRIVFNRAFVNTRSLFNEMGISWDTMFQAKDNGEHVGFVLRSLSLRDYGTLISLFTRVLSQPKKYKSISLKEAVGTLSEKGQAVIEHLPLIMDGVTWNVMSAYEFVKNLDHVGLSTPYTQRVSGKVMCDAMEEAVMEAGGNFVFGTELVSVKYEEDSYEAQFSNGEIIDDGMLFLCLDNSPALKLLAENWGPDADKKVRESTYGAINILIDYENPLKLKSDLEIATSTEWNLQPKVLSDGKTVSCVICHLTEDILTTDPETLKAEVLRQLKLSEPNNIRIGWGAEWNGKTWEFSQSSGVLSLHGQLPFFGKCSKVAMCGMMSPRNTPYSSIEAAVEVSRALCHEHFGTREPLQPILLSQVILLLLVLLIVLILMYRNINQ